MSLRLDYRRALRISSSSQYCVSQSCMYSTQVRAAREYSPCDFLWLTSMPGCLALPAIYYTLAIVFMNQKPASHSKTYLPRSCLYCQPSQQRSRRHLRTLTCGSPSRLKTVRRRDSLRFFAIVSIGADFWVVPDPMPGPMPVNMPPWGRIVAATDHRVDGGQVR